MGLTELADVSFLQPQSKSTSARECQLRGRATALRPASVMLPQRCERGQRAQPLVAELPLVQRQVAQMFEMPAHKPSCINY